MIMVYPCDLCAFILPNCFMSNLLHFVWDDCEGIFIHPYLTL
uniref:Uncharacterized protein n=1 Tax=Rhizophora mucronata TaxID=61149 RepID=A0A2P2N4C7_RHIMU